MVSILASKPSCPEFNTQLSLNFSEEKIVNIAEVNQQCCFEESGQSLENFDCTHLELASGTLVLPKNKISHQ